MRFILKNIEQAITHALQKIDAGNPDLREKIYQTVWYSHEKMLLADQNLTQDEKQLKREQITHLIQTIEAYYQLPQQPSGDVPPVISLMAGQNDPPGTTQATQQLDFSSPTRTTQAHRHKRSWLRANASIIILIVILLVVLWSFYNSLVGFRLPFMSREAALPSINTQVPPPSQAETLPIEVGNASVVDERSWIRIFDPDDMTILSAGGRAQIELRDDDGEGRFVRIQTPTTQDAAIIEVGAGVMMRLAGKMATFDIVVRSASANIAQMSLACDFGGDLNCGRRHFEILPIRENMLFRVDIPENATSAGKILIRHDSIGSDSGIDIFDMRVRVE